MPLLDVDSYRKSGYVLAKHVFARAEVDRMRVEIDAVLARAEAAGRHLDATWRGEWREGAAKSAATRVLSVHDAQNHSALFTRMLVDDRLVDRAAELIGPNVQLHHTKMHVKPPELGSPFPLHQDYPYFPHAGSSMIAAIVFPDDATIENGCICVVPGSHALGPIRHRDDGGNPYLPPDEWPLERAVAVPAEAGDVLFFSYLTVHGSYVNRSDKPRRIVLVQLRDPADRPLDDKHRSAGQGTMLRGIDPGRAPT